MRSVLTGFERKIIEIAAESLLAAMKAKAELWMKLAQEALRLQPTIQCKYQRPCVEKLFEVHPCERAGHNIAHAVVFRRREEPCRGESSHDLRKIFFPDCAQLQVGPRSNLNAAICKEAREGGDNLELRSAHQSAGNPDSKQQAILRRNGMHDAGTEILPDSHKGPAA